MPSMNTKPKFWRSLAELENDPEFLERVQVEFSAPFDAPELQKDGPGRRRFLQVMGASLALGGCRWKEDKLLPFSRRPEGAVPGEARHYATSIELLGVSTGLVVTSYDGRPIKVEGNLAHPTSLGAGSLLHQASVLGLYDPDRGEAPSTRSGASRAPSSWAAFEAFVEAARAGWREGGAKLRVIAPPSASPSLAAMRQRFLSSFPGARWVEYSPVATSHHEQGAKLAFGMPLRATYSLSAAKVVLGIDTELMSSTDPAGPATARGIADGRTPDAGSMSRIYAVESSMTLLGAIADHRLALPASSLGVFLAALEHAVSQQLPEAAASAQPRPPAAFLDRPEVGQLLAALAKDLVANQGAAAIVVGSHLPAEAHALAHRLNVLLGAVGRTVTYREVSEPSNDPAGALSELAKELNEGTVDALFVLGENPVYSAPAALGLAAGIAKAKLSVVLSDREDETAELASWYLPLAHHLETWGDGLGHDGTVTLAQPLIAPLHGARSALEVLALLIGDSQRDPRAIVRRTHASRLSNDSAWNRAVHDGFIANTRAPSAEVALQPLPALSFSPAALEGPSAASGKLEVILALDAKVLDGRFANNSWLQELPEPLTKQAWGNAAWLSPKTAKALGVGDGDLVSISVNGATLTLPALHVPGQAEGSIKVPLGYGRTAAGHVGGLTSAKIEPVGANAFVLRGADAATILEGAQLTRVAGRQPVVALQDLHAIDAIGQKGLDARRPLLVAEASLEEFQKKPDFAQHLVHHPPLQSLWDPPVSYDGHKWGMAIDMNKCIGCSACITACQAENNIAVVGAEQARKGREMLWLRVDRYFGGSAENPSVAFQPIPCQQCENAPCEQVCPVGATIHSSEGLNDMVYNRCIGTRYCSGNCPYKVRRFNYLNFHLDKLETTPFQKVTSKKKLLLHMQFNPEVTVRARGVMEKCTFCVQRIQATKITAKNVKRRIQDGEIKTACQQTCPTQAISFGDLNDPTSVVAKQHALPRAYTLLVELNNLPRVRYLARIRNPHPELS